MSEGRSDYAHVFRVAGLFAVALVLFVVLRWWFIPSDFGVYGFFRAGALEDNRAHPLVYAGRAACVDCHADVVEARRASRHEPIGCESCHGPQAAHAAGEDVPVPPKPDSRTTCIRCHAMRAGKPARFPQVDAADHAPEGPCTACHQPHHPAVS
jgi:hypothetical protein